MKTNDKILSIILATILATVGFSSCQDSIIDDGGMEIPDGKEDSSPYYLALRVFDASAASGSRADFDSGSDDYTENNKTFNHGLAAEYAVYKPATGKGPHYLLIFDETDKLSDLSQLEFVDDDGTDGYDYSLVNQNTGYAKYLTLYTKVSGSIGVDLTADKIMVVLNASDALVSALNTAKEDGKTYSDVCGIKLSGTSDEDFLYKKVTSGSTTTKYFTMSSSMIVKSGSGSSVEVLPALQKTLDGGELKFYTTEEEAKTNPSVVVYVERMQAKYNVLFKKKDNNLYYLDNSNAAPDASEKAINVSSLILSKEDFTFSGVAPFGEKLNVINIYTRNSSIEETLNQELKGIEKDWKVNITGWNVNGLQKSEYVFKNLETYKSDLTDYFTNWNTFPTIRNFWAEDPNYNTSANRKYPDQYRWASTGVTKPYITKDQETAGTDVTGNWILKYFNYTALAQKAIHQYSPECTFDIDVLTSNDPADKAHMRAGTHIIVTAQLLIDGLDSSSVYASTEVGNVGLISDAADKYYMNGIFWSEAAYKEYVAEYLGYYLLNNGSVDGIFYVEDTVNSSDRNIEYKVAGASDFVVEAAHIKGGDGYVWIKPKTGTTLYICKKAAVAGTGEEEGVEAEFEEYSTDSFISLRDAHPEYYAGCYTNGLMYYPIAVKHNTASTSSTIATGDFGSVRNHWYTFTITNIAAPGIPVHSMNQLIIPNNEPVNEALGVNVSVLPWHTLDLDVNVGGQRPSEPGHDMDVEFKPDEWVNGGGSVEEL